MLYTESSARAHPFSSPAPLPPLRLSGFTLLLLHPAESWRGFQQRTSGARGGGCRGDLGGSAGGASGGLLREILHVPARAPRGRGETVSIPRGTAGMMLESGCYCCSAGRFGGCVFSPRCFRAAVAFSWFLERWGETGRNPSSSRIFSVRCRGSRLDSLVSAERVGRGDLLRSSAAFRAHPSLRFSSHGRGVCRSQTGTGVVRF